MSKADILPHP
jgi:hypothetical protein